MDLHGAAHIDAALTLVGELIAATGDEYALVIVGGAALNLLGIVERTTTDVDILAFATPRPGRAPEPGSLYESPAPMPEPLQRAARMVARDLELDPEWLNTGPALRWQAGLPPGLESRVQWHRYGALWVGVVARYDLIALKLFAAADSTGPKSVHYQDLIALNPSEAELEAAVGWVRTQDAAPEFGVILDQVATLVRTELDIA